MLEALTHRAFFTFELPIHRLEKPPKIDGTLRGWKQRYQLPRLHDIDADAGDGQLATVYAGWHPTGLYIAFEHTEWLGQPECDPVNWWKGDGYRICIDTRDARDIRRATRFCHFFYAMPAGGGRNRSEPVVKLHTMTRAKESPPPIDDSQIERAVHIERNYLAMEIGIPGACLHGWDPTEHARIGFFYKAKLSRRGGQTLTVGDEMGWNVDPSTWATAVLTGE